MSLFKKSEPAVTADELRSLLFECKDEEALATLVKKLIKDKRVDFKDEKMAGIALYRDRVLREARLTKLIHDQNCGEDNILREHNELMYRSRMGIV